MLAKRIFDIIFSFMTLILLSPLLLIISVIIKITSEGPAFYKSKRAGKDGKEFYMYKFRSMVNNASEIGPTVTHQDDSRITGLGKFIRRTKIDEFPNLINVLKGDMSIVGPRPLKAETAKNAGLKDKGLLDIKPGVTGMSQLAFANEEMILEKINLDAVYNRMLARKIKLDLIYKSKQSFRLDLWIISKTINTLVFNTNGNNKNGNKIKVKRSKV